MQGAREYAKMFESGQYGKLRIESGAHARGSYFHIYIGERGNEVEVFGILGGHPGWTEYYGWKHNGPWQEDFKIEIEKRKQEMAQKAERYKTHKAMTEQSEKSRVENVLSSYGEKK